MKKRVYEDLDDGWSAGLIPVALTLLSVALITFVPLGLMSLFVHVFGGLGPAD